MLLKEQMVEWVKNTINARKWKYKFNEDTNIFTLEWRPQFFFADLRVFIHVVDEGIRILVFSDTYAKVNLQKVTEYIARVNYSLSFGALEIDCDDGQFRFFVTISRNDLSANLDDINNYIAALVLKSLLIYDLFSTGVFSVIFGVKTPKKASKYAHAQMEKHLFHHCDDDDDEFDDDDDENDDYVREDFDEEIFDDSIGDEFDEEFDEDLEESEDDL